MIAILDAGPWVALIDRSESRHTECVQWLKNFSGRLYSTEAVLTEVLYSAHGHFPGYGQTVFRRPADDSLHPRWQDLLCATLAQRRYTIPVVWHNKTWHFFYRPVFAVIH